MFPAGIECYLDVMDVELMSKERSMPAGLKLNPIQDGGEQKWPPPPTSFSPELLQT